jgi:hypothetical protein
MGYDRKNIQIKYSNDSLTKRKTNVKDVLKSEQSARSTRINEDPSIFCYKMYQDWTQKDSPIDLPVLIMDDKQFMKNKDVNTIPRMYSKYFTKNVKIPFVYHKGRYVSLNKYFRVYLHKEIPSCDDFKSIIMKKEYLERNQDFFESINLFLYTSFLLKQFSCVMKIIPNFYSPISDETKYYFYLIVDFLRRKSIEEDKPLMKKSIIDIIQKLKNLNNIVLNKDAMKSTFPFLDDVFFENDDSIFILKDKYFSFTFSNDQEDIIIKKDQEDIIKKDQEDIMIVKDI